MRAALIRSYGGPDSFELSEVPDPKPIATEVLVRVHAAGLNPVDAVVRSGAFPLLKPPAILGWDISGVVESVGVGVSRFAPGDEVYGMPWFPRAASAYAQLVTVPSRQVARKPARLSHVEAAALPLAGLTAWQAFDAAALSAGQRVLIHGGGGGVGHLAVQIAKARGAYVIATASASKVAFVKQLGADQVIDYQAADFSQQLRDVDVVFEGVGAVATERSLAVLRRAGTLITIVNHFNVELAAKVREAGYRFIGIAVEPDYAGLEQLTALVEAGKLVPHVSHQFALEDVARAHELLGKSVTGKIVLTVS